MLSRRARLRLVRYAKTFLRKVDTRSYDYPGGVSSRFVRLTETFGVRVAHVYTDPVDVVDTFRNHCKAFKAGIAPYCFGLLKAINKNGEQVYGYIVQTVKILNDWYTEVNITPENRDYASKNTGIEKIDRQGRRLYNRVIKVLGFPCGDTHSKNAGWLNGKLVCIDFGPEGRFERNDW